MLFSQKYQSKEDECNAAVRNSRTQIEFLEPDISKGQIPNAKKGTIRRQSKIF